MSSESETLATFSRDATRADRRTVSSLSGTLSSQDIGFRVLYCGLCHTDIHFILDDMAPSFPVTPGHEIVGVVTDVGRNVTKVKRGDKVAVGCMVDSCFGCRSCRALEEQYCLNGAVWTYGGETKYGRSGPDGATTHGGYTDAFVANQRFCFKLPSSAGATYAPLLCAGVTTWDPLVRYGCLAGGKRVGIAGFGGLGHMGTKLAISMRCDAVVLSTSPNKEPAARAMGADFWLTTDAKAMEQKVELAKTRVVTKQDAAVYGWQNPDSPMDSTRGEEGRVCLDLILDTVSAPHDVQTLVDLLAPDGTLVLLGLDARPFALAANALVFSRKVVRGSLIAGTESTEKCLDYCEKNKVFPEVRVVDAEKTVDALKTLHRKNDAAVRYVLDCSTIPKARAAA